MQKKRIGLVYKNKRITLDVFSCNIGEMARGLMFRRRKSARALLFEFDKPCYESIHSVFVFFPFVAVWLDGKKVVDVKVVKPFLPFIRPEKSFDRLIEVPLNDKYKKEISILVGKERFKN